MRRLAPAARKPGNILDRSHRIPNIVGDGCRENIQFRMRCPMPDSWNCMGMWARAKQGGNAYSTVKNIQNYRKLILTLKNISETNTAHLFCISVVRLIICYYIERIFAFVRSSLKKFLVDFPTTSLTYFRLFFRLGKCAFSQFRLNSSNGSSRNAIGFSFRKISCFARSRFPSASFKFLAPPKAAGDVLKNWLPWKKTFFAPWRGCIPPLFYGI